MMLAAGIFETGEIKEEIKNHNSPKIKFLNDIGGKVIKILK